MSTGSADPSKSAPVSPKPCPICGKPPDAGYFPFCSKRCADRDLHRWLGEHYGIAGEPAGGDETSPSDRKNGN
jgi:endogenous inhibitor of DNA gyrase (YacG/DUF329 family)